MKYISRTLIALILAVLMATLMPAQVFADTPEYISEFKIAMGDNAESDLAGYTILKNGNAYVDINQNAGGGIGSKGQKKVLLGYKTTSDPNDAVTDIALMNMKGGYSLNVYDDLMEKNIKEQILPFVNNFITTIEEYRDNCNSNIKANRERAQYMRTILNKMIDDDTGKGLGDLLLKKTKFEMAESYYNSLSDAEKKNHADIVTIISQSNGQATLVMEKLLTRAADTAQNSWIDRFEGTKYDELANALGMTPSDAKKALAKKYDDDAQLILEKWDDFRSDLLTYDDALNYVKNYKETDIDSIKERIESLDEETDADELVDLRGELSEAEEKILEYNKNANIVTIHDYLNERKYGDTTMLEFFLQPSEELYNDITAIYPMVAALSDGQRAGLEFVTLEELVVISQSDINAYRDLKLEETEDTSIYKGVDRRIFETGGVALTTDELRSKAMEASVENELFEFPVWMYVMMGLSAAATVGFLASAVTKFVTNSGLRMISRELTKVNNTILEFENAGQSFYDFSFESLNRGVLEGEDVILYQSDLTRDLEMGKRVLAPKNAMCNKLMIGFGIAAVILTSVTVYLSWKQIKDHYKVEYTNIPRYIVDEKDIIVYNRKGEQVFNKNFTAYYKVVECNRPNTDENYQTLQNYGDINGDVGAQWLAMYTAKNPEEKPILANTLTVQVGSSSVPAGYRKGAHLFGTDAVLNLNSAYYCWNKEAPGIYIFYKTSDEVSAAGSNFTAGSLALACGGGILLGAAVSVVCINAKKRKEETSVTA